MVIVSAGRRVDAPDATAPRFPSANVIGVREKIRALLTERRPTDVITAAACGSDLLLLDTAGELKVRRHVILPSSREEFRKSSVADRPGGWEILYDRIVTEAAGEGGVKVLSHPAGQEGYLAANVELIAYATSLAAKLGTHVVALAIWNGTSRGDDDVTAHFMRSAAEKKIPVTEIKTL